MRLKITRRAYRVWPSAAPIRSSDGGRIGAFHRRRVVAQVPDEGVCAVVRATDGDGDVGDHDPEPVDCAAAGLDRPAGSAACAELGRQVVASVKPAVRATAAAVRARVRVRGSMRPDSSADLWVP
jgi:hypothetical protein